jgi:glycosyltransferase involved in cell wall biosynthesis
LLVFVHEYVTYSRLGKLRLFLMLLPAHAIVTSDSINMAALRALPFRRAPVFLYPTGCSIPVTDEKPPRERRPQGGRLRVLFFGLIQKGKGVDALLSAFAQSPELRRRAELHVIGGLGAAPTAPERELHAQLLRLPYVVAHGFVPAESLGAHFHDMDVMIVPFENGVTERRTSFMAGLAFGLPVITTRPSVPLEGLQHMGNVILMEEASPRSIEHAIDATAGLDSQELGTIGAMGRQWYEKRFSEEILYSRFRAIEDSLTHH